MAKTFGQITDNIQQFVPDLSTIVIKQRINYRYQQILRMRDWEYLKDDIATGTSTYINTDTSCTTWYQQTKVRNRAQSGASFRSHHVGWWIRFGSESQPYEITSVQSVSRATLAAPYSGATAGLTGSSFTLFRAVYRTSVSMSHIYSMVYQDELSEYSIDRLNSVDPERTDTGEPQAYCIVERSRHQGRMKFQLWPITDDEPYTIRIYYKKLVSDLSAETDIPLCSPELLESWALFDCYKIASVKNENYLKLLQFQAADLAAVLEQETQDDLETTTLPKRVRDTQGGTVMNDDYALDHDTEPW